MGIAAIFMETHPNLIALSDGPNSIPLHEMKAHLQSFSAVDRLVKHDLVYAD